VQDLARYTYITCARVAHDGMKYFSFVFHHNANRETREFSVNHETGRTLMTERPLHLILVTISLNTLNKDHFRVYFSYIINIS